MELRKRSAPPPVQDTAALSKRAAVEVLNGSHGGSARAAADHYALPFHSHIQYYVDKWRDSEVAELVALTGESAASQARAMAESPSPDSQIAVTSPTPESLLPSMPDHVRANSKTSGKTWVAKQAGLLVQRGECSIRAAMEMANLKYGATGVGSVSYGTVYNYSKDDT